MLDVERGGLACSRIVPADGELDAVLACGGGVGVASFCRGGDRLGRAVGLDVEGWLGGGGCWGGCVGRVVRVDGGVAVALRI